MDLGLYQYQGTGVVGPGEGDGGYLPGMGGGLVLWLDV